MRTTCKICGEQLSIQTAGRIRTYCSSKCRQKGYRERKKNSLPAEMIAAERWTAADGKRPMTATGRAASSIDSNTWTTHDAVALSAHGFMLGGGFACIDLDSCIRGGKLQSWAKRIIDAVPGACIELSLSGKGLHIFGLLPESNGRRKGRVEVYSRQRFIRTTGKIWRPGGLVALTPAVATINKMAKNGDIPDASKKHLH